MTEQLSKAEIVRDVGIQVVGVEVDKFDGGVEYA